VDKDKGGELLPDGRRKYMTIQEVADYLTIGRTSAYELISQGDIKAKRFGKKNVRVHVDELKRYEAESDWRPE
jgi:excisionase family DNA binding protein